MTFNTHFQNGFSFDAKISRASLVLGACMLSLSLSAATAHATDHRNFSAWKNETKNEKPRRQRTTRLQDGRGLFETLFSFRRQRRLNEAEIQSRLSTSPPPKPFFYTYKPEATVSLTALALEAETVQAPMAQQIQTLLNASGAKRLRTFKAHVPAIRGAYVARKFQPLWLSDRGLTSAGERLLSKLAAAEEEGLDPKFYLPASLNSFRQASVATFTQQELARLELELTIAALTYAKHASSGILVPSKIGRNFDVHPVAIDPAEVIQMLIEGNAPDRVLARLHPAHPAYRAMKNELDKLLKAQNTAEPHIQIPDGKVLRENTIDARVPMVRKRLAKLGFPVKTANEKSADEFDFEEANDLSRIRALRERAIIVSQTYDNGVVEAIRAFQRASKLKPDGLLGRRTLAALNKPPASPETKIKKLKIAMERMRWLPRTLGKRHILVNKPAYVARVIDDGKTTHRMRVVVGKPRFPTAEFYDQMEHVVFNPYWNVPRSIAGNEMLPKLWNDPSYLDRTGYEVRDRRGRQVSSSSVDWWAYTGRTMPYDIRQPPGRSNALGAVKFMFPNKHAIYMHDTPAKNLFERLTRAYSHGCVRVQTPRKFAEIVLGWNRARVDSAIASGQNRKVNLSRNIPVYLTYFTAWPEEDGTIRYYDDVYNRDAAMHRAMQVVQPGDAQS